MWIILKLVIELIELQKLVIEQNIASVLCFGCLAARNVDLSSLTKD